MLLRELILAAVWSVIYDGCDDEVAQRQVQVLHMIKPECVSKSHGSKDPRKRSLEDEDSKHAIQEAQKKADDAAWTHVILNSFVH